MFCVNYISIKLEEKTSKNQTNKNETKNLEKTKTKTKNPKKLQAPNLPQNREPKPRDS